MFLPKPFYDLWSAIETDMLTVMLANFSSLGLGRAIIELRPTRSHDEDIGRLESHTLVSSDIFDVLLADAMAGDWRVCNTLLFSPRSVIDQDSTSNNSAAITEVCALGIRLVVSGGPSCTWTYDGYHCPAKPLGV